MTFFSRFPNLANPKPTVAPTDYVRNAQPICLLTEQLRLEILRHLKHPSGYSRRGVLDKIAERTGRSVRQVQAVLEGKFENDDILIKASEVIAEQFAERNKQLAKGLAILQSV
jgi:hypothetical protein